MTPPLPLVTAMTILPTEKNRGDAKIVSPANLSRGTFRQQTGIQILLVVANLRMNLLSHRVDRGGKAVPLQPREFKLVEFPMRHEE
jgi:DNA-binding response OmpR family regulator